ncbi:3'-5' exonuclease, partial [Zobellella denitrificans]|uniref:3'-5' exonuclease n=1 Tax=Zobellella denitrificans TaxID=347534 RepID=UPI0026E12B6E
PALTLWQLDGADGKPFSGGAYVAQMAGRCAGEIVRLLNLGRRGQAGFAGADGFAPVRSRDIAVLVRGFREAQAIRRALAELGVKSVYLSDKDSVYQSPEALDLLFWLRACAEPEQDVRLRAALATATLGLGLAELERLNQDERHWERRGLQVWGYPPPWERPGGGALGSRPLAHLRPPAPPGGGAGGGRFFNICPSRQRERGVRSGGPVPF